MGNGEGSTQPSLDCDIVMAGGVTSGIIYPGAIAVIARRYRFRSIGGTSVGAIAASVTAAAEFGRLTNGNPNAFEGVAAVPFDLGTPAPDGHSRLFHLFTPEAATKPLMDLVAPLFAGGGASQKIAGIVRGTLRTPRIVIPSALAVLAGVVPLVLQSEGRIVEALIALVAVLSLVVASWFVATMAALWLVWLPAWRANGYGLCKGSTSLAPGKGADAINGLTPWMHDLVQAVAGLAPDKPLTFGDLWGAGTGAEVIDNAAPRVIELAMITSDISRNRSIQLPFLEAISHLYVEEQVLREYFPAGIAEWMMGHKGDVEPDVETRPGLIRLPLPGNLPVVFAARLSLSFPVLLSAVPLWTPDYVKRKHGQKAMLRRVWFSDGGLTSNFPIHFFDSPVPTRPTFCLNLVDYDAEAPGIADGAGATVKKPIASPDNRQPTSTDSLSGTPGQNPQPGDAVWGFVSMSSLNEATPAPFTSFDKDRGPGIASFGAALVNTARFWVDNQLIGAPGVRDRVANILLKPNEGGLNLDMTADTIAELDLRGRAAGLLLSARFDPVETVDPETGGANIHAFANHRWVRYRNVMAAFEDLSRRFASSRRASDTAARLRNESCLDAMINGTVPETLGYHPLPPRAVPFYHFGTDALEKLGCDLADKTKADPVQTFDRPNAKRSGGAAPRPAMRFFLRSLADNDPRARHADFPNSQGADDSGGSVGT